MSKIARAVFVSWTVAGFTRYVIAGRTSCAEDWLFRRFYKLGGLYIKFLQLLALRDSESTVPVSTDPTAVFDQVTYEPVDILQVLNQELGVHARRVQLDSCEPFAAGSFAQVYGASLDGSPVVIKLLRPSVRRYLRFDLKLLGLVARALELIQPRGMVDIASAYSGFKDVTLKEIDYPHEVKLALELGKRLEDHRVIDIPKTYAALSTENIIVQQRVVGVPLTSLLASQIDDKRAYVWRAMATDLNYVLEELAVELIEGSLHGGTHGDPHPGNIYLLANNKIALIDFGISATVSKHQPELIALLAQYAALYRGEFDPEQFAQAMVQYFTPELTHSIQTVSAFLGEEDLLKKTLSQLGETASQALSDRASDPSVNCMLEQHRMLRLFTQVVNKDNRFGLQVSIETPAFMRSGQILMTLVHKLGCDTQLLRRTFERVVELNKDIGSQQDLDYNRESIDRSFHTLASWFERLSYSDPKLYNMIIKTWEPAA